MKKQNSGTFPGPNQIFQGLFQGQVYTITHIFISQKQLETTFFISIKIDNKIGQVDLFQLALKSVT